MCQSLERLGHHVEIAIIGKDKYGIWNGPYIELSVVPIKFVRSVSFWTNNILKFVLSCIKGKPDVVILDIFSLWMSVPLLILPRSKRPLFIVDNRTPFFGMGARSNGVKSIIVGAYTWISYKYAKSFLDGMTVITEHYKNRLCDRYGFSNSKIGIWSSGVDVDQFSVDTSDIDDPALENKFLIIQHGEISYNRGLFETVKAISLLPERKITLLLIGDSVRSDAKNELWEYAKQLGISDRLILKPPIEHSRIPQYIKKADCAVMAYPDIEYWNSNNPIKLLEYLALGKVIICTDTWTFRNVMQNSNCGCYIEDNKPESIAKAMLFCYENRDNLKSWGEEGVKIVKNRFTWEQQARELIKFIHQLSSNK